MQIRQMNFGWLHSPPLPPACCHCLLVQDDSGVLLVDTGIGMHDVKDPVGRIGPETIEAAGFKFLPEVTAVQQLAELGIKPGDVTDIVITHCDYDHVGGLADFPDAKVHLSHEELENLKGGNPRFGQAQFAHGPHWVSYEVDDSDALGMPSRRISTSLNIDLFLVPLFGHTRGHCGVAMDVGDRWYLHVGDAYYLRGELDDPAHPVGQLATTNAEDNEARLNSLERIRQLIQRDDIELTYFGYHDTTELPAEIPAITEFL